MKNRRRLAIQKLEGRECPATITVQNTVIGTTPDVLGYNMGHFMPGTNAADWMRYEGVKAVRAFVSPTNIEPSDDIPGIGDGVTDSASFFARRSALRANAANPNEALNNSYINWPYFQNYFTNALQSNNRFMVDYAFGTLRGMGVEILANITATPSRFPIASDSDWANKWELWQHYYAEAFYMGGQFDVRRYSMFNEPTNYAGMTPSDWLRRLYYATDAMQCAIADVNVRYNKSLVPQILAPNTAGGDNQYIAWGRPAVLGIHSRIDGTTDPNWNNFHVYNYQKYSTLATSYVTDINALQANVAADLSGGLPMALTEYNVRTNSSYDSSTVTLDTPSDYAALGTNSIALAQENARQLYLFKFAQTESSAGTTYPVQKNGTHYVHNGSTGANYYGGATKGAEVYRLFNKAAIGARNHYSFTSNAGSNVWSLVTFDPLSNTYFAYISNLATSSVSLGLNLTAFGIPEGNQAVIEEVSGNYSGGVSRVASIVGGQLPAATMAAQSVWLVSIPVRPQSSVRIPAAADTTVGDGSRKDTPGGTTTNLLVRADGTVDGRKAVLLKFPITGVGLAGMQRALLDFHASTLTQSATVQAHVYGLNDNSWIESTATWSNLSLSLLQNVAAGNQIGNNVASGQGTTTQMLGQLVVNSPTLAQRQIDVTDFVRGQTDGWASFLILQDHRWDTAIPALTSGDTQADGIRIASRELGDSTAPGLIILSDRPTPSSLVVNGGAVQRSRLTTITVHFPTLVNAADLGTITLTRAGGTIVQTGATGANGRITVTPATGLAFSFTLTFDNANGSATTPGVESGSLADGRWQLSIPSFGYQSSLNDSALSRLFGDADGDGDADNSDFVAFRLAFGNGSSIFDADGDGDTDIADFVAFRSRFGATLP